MSKEPNRNVYVGHRYVPKIMGEWNQSTDYEGLSIVTYQGASYTSKKRVPVGIDISNEEFWVVTGNYNAQVEYYREETERVSDKLDSKSDITYVDNELDLKSDKTYVDSELDLKSDKTYVDSELDLKSDKTYVDNEMDLKSDKTYVDNELDKKANQTDIDGRGVNLKSLGFKLDGRDELEKINQAFIDHQHLIHPGGDLGVSDTLFIPRGCSLIGGNENVREVYNRSTPTIKYIGIPDNRRAVVVLGGNDVGEEPDRDTSNLRLKNIFIDADYKAGFCLYGTFLVNETMIKNIVAKGSTEHNIYLARGWYATIEDLFSLNCKGKGISLGMPLTYQNGDSVTWTTFAPLELNNVKINNIRSIHSGEFYSKDNPGLYDPTKSSHRMNGYGVGAGYGASFNIENITSEGSGGVNLYVLTGAHSVKTISKAYLELSARNSSLDPGTEMPNIIIENKSSTGGMFELKDIFMNYESGGIYHIGEKRRVMLKNVHQPRFLRSLNGLSAYELYKFVLKDNVFFGAGTHNTLESMAVRVDQTRFNTRWANQSRLETAPMLGATKYIYFRATESGNDLDGGYMCVMDNGQYYSYDYPPDLKEDEWTMARPINGQLALVRKGVGEDSEIDKFVDIKIVTMPATNS